MTPGLRRVYSRVVSVSYYRSHCKPGHGTAVLQLACGHVKRMKKSQYKQQVHVACHHCLLTQEQRQQEQKDNGKDGTEAE